MGNMSGGYVDYSKYKGFCCGCMLRISWDWESNHCPKCNRLYRQKKKNKRADKLRELRKKEPKYLVIQVAGLRK